MKTFLRTVSAVLIIALALLTCSCTNPPDNQLLSQPEQLPAPQNIRSEGKVIFWDAVENAVGYIVEFENTVYETAECFLDLSFYEDLGTYQIEIRALSDSNNYLDSEWASFSYTPTEPTDPGVTDQPTKPGDEDGPVKAGYDENGFSYHLLPDGSGYEFARGKVDIFDATKAPKVIVVPESYCGLPVKGIKDYGFAPFRRSDSTWDDGSNGVHPNPFKENGAGNHVTTTIILPSTLERIGVAAFAGTYQLEEIIIPDSV